MKINEGLKQGDLKGTILSNISINEYESKLDSNANVIGFYAIYQDPAKDLNRFIQKSSISLLDTEVSPSPTPKGYYMVFVEMENNKNFVDDLLTILSNLENLTNIKKWTFSTVQKNNIPLTKENIKKYITDKKAVEKIKEFFYNSYLNNFIITENKLTIDKQNFKIYSYGNTDIIKEKYNLKNISINESDVSKTLNLQFKLGENWKVDIFESGILVSNNNKSVFMREI